MIFTSRVEAPTDGVSFEEYAAAAWPRLYRSAYLLTGHHADAEDVAQQTLVKAHAAWSKVTAARTPDAYVRRILTNTFLSAKRPKARGLELLTDDPPERPPSASPAAHPGQPGAAVEDRMVLWPHVKQLPPQQRAVIVLRYYEDLSEAEIAETLGCSRGTVKSTAHRALTALRSVVPAAGDADSTETTGEED